MHVTLKELSAVENSMQENTTDNASDTPEDFNEWNLEPHAEYRFELESGSAVSIKVYHSR